MSKMLLENISVVGPKKIRPENTILIEDDIISAVFRKSRKKIQAVQSEQEASDVKLEDVEKRFSLPDGYYAAPGFIDIHTHGAAGRDITDGKKEAWKKISRFKLSCGTTSYLATIVSSPPEKTKNLCRRLTDYISSGEDPVMLGVHMEGPFLNPEKKGAQNEKHLREPDLTEVKNWHEILGSYLQIISLAPELEGSREIIGYAGQNNIVTGAAHTVANYEQTRSSFEAGLELGVHFLNGMKAFHHRDPGVIGAFLEEKDMPVEIIADGIHLHPATIRMLINNRDPYSIIAVTDAMRAAGCEEGTYELGGQSVYIEDGEARLENGSLAGSTLTMEKTLKNLISIAGLDISSACRLLSKNPADLLGLGDRGEIAAGKKADIVILDEELNVEMTVKEGKVVDGNSNPAY